MATIDTLVEFYNHKKAVYENAKKRAEEKLKTLKESETKQRQNREKSVNRAAELEAEQKRIRGELSEISTAAHGQALAQDLEQTIISARGARAARQKYELALFETERAIARWTDDLGWAAAAGKEADSRLKAAEQEENKRKELKKSLTAAVAALQHNAENAMNKPDAKDAEERVRADLPKPLLDRAHNRAQVERNRLVESGRNAMEGVKAVQTQRSEMLGRAATLERVWAEFRTAEAAFADYVLHGKERFDSAMAKFKSIADPELAPLTEPVLDRIWSGYERSKEYVSRYGERTLTDEEKNSEQKIHTDREKALDKEGRIKQGEDKEPEETVNRKRRDYHEKKIALSEAVLSGFLAKLNLWAKKDPDREDSEQSAEVKDLQTKSQAAEEAVTEAENKLKDAERELKESEDDWRKEEKVRDEKAGELAQQKAKLAEAIAAAQKKKIDPETDPEVEKAKDAVDRAETELSEAQRKYRESEKGILDAWEAAVPDANWAVIASFEEARWLLEMLKDKNNEPVNLEKKMDENEKKLVNRLLQEFQSERTFRSLEIESGERKARDEFLAKTQNERLQSALRGDD